MENETLSTFVETYYEYIKIQCPTIDINSLTHLTEALENTSWEDPESTIDFNNCAVIALIESEKADDLEIKQLYLDMAVEYLEKGVELNEHPLCAVHLALVLALLGEHQKCLQIVWPNLLNPLQFVYHQQGHIPISIVYLPPVKSSLKNYHTELLYQCLIADNGYNQSVILMSEALGQSQLFFYSYFGQLLLHLTSKICPNFTTFRLKLLICDLLQKRKEDIPYHLEYIEKINSNDPIILQSLYIAYRHLGETTKANSALDQARDISKKYPEAPDWKWTELPSDSEFTYLTFDHNINLAVEPTFSSIVTSVLMAEGDWFEHEMEFLRNWIQPGMTVIDVGANVGVYTFSAAMKVGAEGKVLAVEPFSKCVRYLQETCRINEINWVKILAGAASDKCGSAKLLLYSASESNELISDEAIATINQAQFEEVKCFTLDSLIDTEQLNKVDFIKMDAEGHELSVLAGSSRILSEFKPIILYENIAGTKGSNLPVAEYLISQGYQLFRYKPYVRELIPVEIGQNLQGNLNLIAIPYKPKLAQVD